MRWGRVLLSVLLWPSLAWADVTVIYRKADRQYVGAVYPPHSVVVEMEHLTRSSLGGVPGDYDTLSVDDVTWATRKGQQVIITPGGTLRFDPDPETVAQQQRRQAAKQKLRGLGLTQEEVDAVVGE